MIALTTLNELPHFCHCVRRLRKLEQAADALDSTLKKTAKRLVQEAHQSNSHIHWYVTAVMIIP